MENPFETIVERLDKIENLIRNLSLGNIESPLKPIMSMEEVSRYLSYSKSYLYKLTSGNEIPHYKKGKKIFFNKTEIDKWILSNRKSTLEEINQEAVDYLSFYKK